MLSEPNAEIAALPAPTAMNQQKLTFSRDGKTVPGGIVKYHLELSSGRRL